MSDFQDLLGLQLPPFQHCLGTVSAGQDQAPAAALSLRSALMASRRVV